MLVIFSHSYPLGTGSELAEPINILTKGQVTGGHLAVDLFFIISGFLITASFERSKSIATYLKKRFLRIYPGFVVAMLFELLIVLPANGGHLAAISPMSRVGDFGLQTIRLQEFHYAGAFPTTRLQVWLWIHSSIPYEFWCYIGVALLGICGVLRSNRVLLGLSGCSITVAHLFAVFRLTPGANCWA